MGFSHWLGVHTLAGFCAITSTGTVEKIKTNNITTRASLVFFMDNRYVCYGRARLKLAVRVEGGDEDGGLAF